MTRQDLLDAIPNSEGVDTLMIDRVLHLYKGLCRFEELIELEDLVLAESTREGNIATKANPFWNQYIAVKKAFMGALAELGLTPKVRKTLIAQDKAAGIVLPSKK